MEEAARSVILDGRRIGYTLRRNPRSRGLRAVIDPDRGLLISVPPSRRRGWAAPEPLVERFLGDRQAWVVRHLDRLEGQRAAQRARGGARDGGSVRYLGEPHRVRVLAASPTVRRSTVERTGADDGDELTIRLGGRDRRQPERVLEAWLRERARAAIERALARHAAALGVAPSSVHVRDPRARWGSTSKEGRLMFSWRLILAPPDALETVVVHELAHLRVFGHGPRFWTLVAGRRPGHLADRGWLRRHSHELHAALETTPAAEAGTASG